MLFVEKEGQIVFKMGDVRLLHIISQPKIIGLLEILDIHRLISHNPLITNIVY